MKSLKCGQFFQETSLLIAKILCNFAVVFSKSFNGALALFENRKVKNELLEAPEYQ